MKHQDREFVRMGRSRIEGKGVFAKRNIPRGTRIIEYTGQRVPLTKLLVEIGEGKPAHIYAFRLNETTVIDGSRNGNEARFINHSCDPNCEAYVFDDNLYIYAMMDISRGDELTFDYNLSPARKGGKTKHEHQDPVCRCGSKNCRGTMRLTKRKPKIP